MSSGVGRSSPIPANDWEAALGDVGITQSRLSPPATSKPEPYWKIIHPSMNHIVSIDGLALQEDRVKPNFTDPHHRLSSSLTDSRGQSIVNGDSCIESLERRRKASLPDAGSREIVLRPHWTRGWIDCVNGTQRSSRSPRSFHAAHRISQQVNIRPASSNSAPWGILPLLELLLIERRE